MEKFNKTYTVAGVIREIKEGFLGMKALEQREYCWGKEEQTEWIDTILNSEKWKIPSLTGAESEIIAPNKKDGKEVYVIDLMDGLQRSTTLKMFAEDEFILSNNIDIVTYEDENGEVQEYNPIGKKFSELPSDIRKKFMTTKIPMDYYRDITPNFRRKLFLKLNSGKPLKNSEKNKNRMNPTASDFIYKTISSDLFAQYIKGLPKQMAKFEAVQQVLLVMSDIYNLSGKQINEFSSNFVLEDSLKNDIENITEYLNTGFAEYKQTLLPDELKNTDIEDLENKLDEKTYKKFVKPIEYMKKVNIPMVYNIAKTAIDSKINANEFVQFLSEFFEKVPADYKRCTGSGSADESNVKSRIAIITDAYNTYFKKEAKTKEPETPTQENKPVVQKIKSSVPELDMYSTSDADWEDYPKLPISIMSAFNESIA
jgi:hypothetical protein